MAKPDENDGFVFRQRGPGPALAPFVQRLWYARGRIAYWRDHILPNGRAVLLVNLGAAHATTPTAGHNNTQVLRESWVCGPQTRALVNEPLGETHIVGATFATAGAALFFDPPLSELANRVIPLEALWGPRARSLRQEILEAATAAQKLACLERGLLTRLRPVPRGLARLEAALRRLLVPGPTGVAVVARQVELSPKQLIAEFHRLVGVTPGKLERIARLGRLLEEVDPRHDVPWAELAAGFGWADQAHLIRDFRAFAGTTPAQYLRQRRALFGPDLAPGQDVTFLPSGSR